MMHELTLIRRVSKTECPWLIRDFEPGDVVHRYFGLVGCHLSDDDIAVSVDGHAPYFGLPMAAFKEYWNLRGKLL